MWRNFIDAALENANDEDDEIVVYDRSNIETGTFRRLPFAGGDGLDNNLEAEEANYTLSMEAEKPTPRTSYAVDKDITTMDQAVRVPRALQCAGRRTMFDVLVKFREEKEKARDEEENSSLVEHNELNKNSRASRDLTVDVQERCGSQSNHDGVVEASASSTGMDVEQNKLRRGLKHLLPKHLQKEERIRLGREAEEEKRRRAEEAALALDISDFSSSASESGESGVDMGRSQPCGARLEDFSIADGVHASLGSATAVPLLSLSSSQAGGSKGAVAVRSVWEVFQQKEVMAVRRARARLQCTAPAARTALNTDPFRDVAAPFSASAHSTAGRGSASSGGDKTLDALLDDCLAESGSGGGGRGADFLGRMLYKQDRPRLSSLNPTPARAQEPNGASSLAHAHSSRNGVVGKPTALHIHSLASNPTGSACTGGGLPPPQSRGQLDRRAARQLLKVPMALRVVEYLRQAFSAWTLNGSLLQKWCQQQAHYREGTGALQNTFITSGPQTTAHPARDVVEQNDTSLKRATSKDPASCKSAPKKLPNEEDFSQHSVESHTSSLAEQDLEESGIHLAFMVLSIDVAYGLTHALGELVWAHPSIKCRLRSVPRGSAFATPQGISSREVEGGRVRDVGGWRLVIPDPVLRAVPMLVGHWVFLAEPFFVYPGVGCILCGYNFTSDVLVAEHGAVTTPQPQRSAAVGGSGPIPPGGVLFPSDTDRTPAKGSSLYGPGRGRLSLGRGGNRSEERGLAMSTGSHFTTTPSKDLYDPLARPIVRCDSPSVSGRALDATVWDVLGTGFPRGPGAAWDVPLEVLHALTADRTTSLLPPQGDFPRRKSPSRGQGEYESIPSKLSNTSYQLTAHTQTCEGERESVGRPLSWISSSRPTSDSEGSNSRR